MLEYYTSLGVVEVQATTLAGTQPNHPGLQHDFIYREDPHRQQWMNEHIPVNDCFFRNMYRYSMHTLKHFNAFILFCALLKKIFYLIDTPTL